MIRQTTRISFLFLFAGLISCCAFAGCSSSGDQPKLGYVGGTVRLDGAPLADATVFFSPKDGGRTSVGHTDEDGKYQLSYIGEDSGAKVGTHVVRVTTSQEVEDSRTGRTIHTPEKVPDQYNSRSDLLREVAAGSNTLDLDLKSKTH